MTSRYRSGLDDWSPQPFSRLPAGRANDIVVRSYGLRPLTEPARLATERDDTFHVRAAEGEFILKVAAPDEDESAIDLQIRALAYAAQHDPELPLQRVVADRHGSMVLSVETTDGPRLTRLLSYLPGMLLRHSAPKPTQLRALGRVHARLAVALEGFHHPSADRYLLFDLQNFAELRVLLRFDASGLTSRVFDWFDDVFSARAPRLPRQVLHTDLGLDNVVVSDASRAYVTGILDWGDVVRTWRAADLASGLASQAAEDGPAWARPAEIVAGYQSVQTLTDDELELLPGLVAMRLAQRILLAEWLSATTPANAEYLGRNLPASYRQLANLQY